GDRPTVVHQLAEQPAKQEHGKPLRNESTSTAHEGVRPMSEKRLTRNRSGQDGSRRCYDEYGPPSIGKPHHQAESEQYPDESHGSVLHQQQLEIQDAMTSELVLEYCETQVRPVGFQKSRI